MSERVHKSVLNAEVNLIFYFLTLFLAFFSRKIFLDCLGTEFIGLTGTLGNILGYLNLAEFGITASVGYFLFKPLQTNNHQEIQEILSVLGYLYNRIGFIILTGGMIISLFFPFFFSNTNLDLGIIYFAFYSFLGSSLIGYFINYRQTLLSADQKNYIVAIYFQSANILRIILQIFLAYYYRNLYLWVGVEFLFGIIGCIILNWKINKEYPWLHVEKENGHYLIKKYPEIIAKTKQVFIHKIKDFVLVKSDELFIFLFVSLKMVAYYGNYMIVISKLISLFYSITGSIGASIGNLVAEGDNDKMMKVFWELTTIQHTVAAILSFALYSFLEPFIAHWLGTDYIMDHRILILLILYIYITNSRQSVDGFNFAHGLYADVWSAWTELGINITVTLAAGYYWGISGILLGKIVSTFLIIVIWKPYYLFHSGLHESYFKYWQGAVRNYGVSIVSIISAHYCVSIISVNNNGYSDLIIYCLIGSAIFLTINSTLNIIFCKGARDCFLRIRNLFNIRK